MVYKWRGYNYGVKAQIVGEEIEKIEQEQGSVTAQAIVNAARSEENPMHSLFEWDDHIAAEKFRCDTAGRILSCLVVTSEIEEPTRAFVNIVEVAHSNKGVYANIKSAMENNETREIVLKNAIAELMAIRSKYSNLSELAGVFTEIDKLETA